MNLLTIATNMEPKNRTKEMRKYARSILVKYEIKKKLPASAMKKNSIKTNIIASHFPTKPPGILFLREEAIIILMSINRAPNNIKM